MKKNLLVLMLGIIFFSCSSSKERKYFDQRSNEISKSNFLKIRSANKNLTVQKDSSENYKLILREERGKIKNKNELTLLLEVELNKKIDSTKPIIIIYYPGKDLCNSSGTSDRNWIKIWYEELEKGIKQIVNTSPIYIYKDKEGLEKYDRIITWNKDPERVIELLFFKSHYLCNSFVVISKDGDYISYFGEFTKEYIWEATKILNK